MKPSNRWRNPILKCSDEFVRICEIGAYLNLLRRYEMTAKRFELMSDDEVIIDNCSIADDGGKQTYWIVEYGQRVKVVELLNELHEENKELRLLVNTLKEQNMKFKLRLNDLGVEYL